MSEFKREVSFAIHPVKCSILLFGVTLLLLAFNLIGIYLKFGLGADHFFVNALVYYFDASLESNIPTLFSTIILLLAAILLLVIRKLEDSPKIRKHYWLVLAVIFLFLAVDEAASIHEQFNKFGGDMRDTSGYLYYFWVVPYAVFALIAGIYFLRFLAMLPAKTRNLFIISGLVYVLSAIGFELLEGRITRIYWVGHLYDKLLCAAEEFLEMASITLFNYALLDYLGKFRQKMPFLVYFCTPV